ncbi:PEP-CTERM sorting domain-containing protein [Roseateles sp.]|uniref:PEP-CTERM sorting domain-containing protein n=1 Tax=Roseateles sp. TaxID=1971397 RepID=UPI0039ECBFEB
MTRWPCWAACALFCLNLPAIAQPSQVVTFEEISPNDLTDGYGGLAGWSGLGGSGIADRDMGGNGLKSFYGHGGVLTFLDSPVRVFGTYYKSYAVDLNEPAFSAVELWYQGQPVASIADPRTPLAMAWLTTNYSGPVDAIRFRGGMEGFSIDDLTYEPMQVSNVPEPAPWALLAAGLGLLARQRRHTVTKVQADHGE